MVKIVAMLGDYWHPEADAKLALEAIIEKLPNKEEIELQYVSHEDLAEALDHHLDLFINSKMDILNPLDEHIKRWLTEELDNKIIEFVEAGGNMLAWHAGMASFPTDTKYLSMLRGAFEYHPPGLQAVTYTNADGLSFTIEDELYIVNYDKEHSEAFMWSKGKDGESTAGWQHHYGKGKVCCFVPAHTKEGLLDENVTNLLAKKIEWLLSK